MRCTLIAVLAAALLTPSAAFGQKLKRTTFTGAEDNPRVGFQAGLLPNETGKSYIFKAGLWAPMSVDFIVGDDPLPNAELSVECGDSDDVQNTYTIKLPPLNPGQSFTANTYVRVGSRGGELVTRITQGGTEIAIRRSNYDTMELDDLLFVTVGPPIDGIRRAMVAQRRAAGDNANNPAMGGQWNNFGNRQNEGMVGQLTNVRDMPRHWFGYQAADVAFLSTSNPDFVKELIGDKQRHNSLMQWVLRGGKLMISAGRNSDLLPSLAEEVIEAADNRRLARIKVLPGGLQVSRLQGIEAFVRGQFPPPLEAPVDKDGAPGKITIAKLQRKPGKDVEVLAEMKDGDETHPLLVRIPYGTGQILLAAFDIDQTPFSTWGGQNDFWKRVQDDMGVALTTVDNLPPRNWGGGFDQATSNDVGGNLLSLLQAFPDVSNISFGWVALFIFVYIIVVGPLDYFFLKKVVKRLELTWITFPTVVLVVSVIAYFTAYALKGNDLLINKADLVDIDLEGQTGYGHTWFTLFSPRIQNYTVGIEPAAPIWAKTPGDDDRASTVLLSWMGKPDDSYGGMGRSRSQSLFRRTYNYAPDATGLEGVPIQVWSMKSFDGSWVRPVNPETPPFVADLKFGGEDNRRPVGTITNQLPFDLIDVHLIVGQGPNRGGTVYSLDKNLSSGTPQRILGNRAGRPLSDWLTNSNVAQPLPGQQRPAASSKNDVFKHMSFFEVDPNSRQKRNITMRNLDVSWRLRLKNEAILVGRVAPKNSPAETLTNDPITASKLWLGKLPGGNETRPSLLGTVNQETYVRVFIPIKAGRGNDNE
jgi:hypothetical protein